MDNQKQKMKNENELFIEALTFIESELYFDAINSFKIICKNFEKSDLVDDCYLNIGICYMKLNLFDTAIENFNIVINEYPDSKLTSISSNIEEGFSPAKAYYGIILCKKSLGIESNEELLKLKDYDNNTYVIHNNKKTPFSKLLI